MYSTVSTEVAGNKPGVKMKVTGDYINYSVTILDNAPQKEEAIKFLEFMLSREGQEIFRKNGQEPLYPLVLSSWTSFPRIC